MASRILITGAGGFVGGYLFDALIKRWPASEIIGIGHSTSPIGAVDICDSVAVNKVVSDCRPDIVVHLAAQASVGALEQDGQEQTWRVNIGGTLNLALAVARYSPLATVLFASSSEVYGLAFGSDPVDEAIPPRPVNAYAKTKLLGEKLLSDVLPKTARLIIARPFNHTGPGQREDFVLASFAGQIARIEAGVQEPVIQVGNLDARRDFLDVRDIVAAYCQLIAAAPSIEPRITCNIASGTSQPVRSLLTLLQRASRVPFDIIVDPARLRPSDIPIACGNSAYLRGLTGWSPGVSIEETLLALLQAARTSRSQSPARF